MKYISFLLIGLTLLAWGCKRTAPYPTPAVTTPAPQNQVFENEFLKLTLAPGWTAATVSNNPAAINITKGNFILYINSHASQTGGAEGGRFAEIAQGAPSADAVVTVQPSEPCGTLEKTFLFDIYSRADLYVGTADKKDYCVVPTNGSTVWYFSYITTNSGGYFIHDWGSNPSNLVITASYNSKLVNQFPTKNSAELSATFSDVTEMLKSLQLK